MVIPKLSLDSLQRRDNENKVVYKTIVLMVVNRLSHKKNTCMQTRLCREIIYIDT